VDWKRCSLCGKFQSENQAPMKRCAGCYQNRGVTTLYCDKNCQTEHWPRHQVVCKQDVPPASAAWQEEFKRIQKWLSVHADLLSWTADQAFNKCALAMPKINTVSVTLPLVEAPKGRIPTYIAFNITFLTLEQLQVVVGPAGNTAHKVLIRSTNAPTLSLPVKPTPIGPEWAANIASPCPRWQFVLDAMCKKGLQNANTLDGVLMAERKREDLFAEFMGPVFVERPIPASAPLDTDDTMARRLNWVNHPEFVEWYQRHEGCTPREKLSGMALRASEKGGDIKADIPWLLKWIDGDPALYAKLTGVKLSTFGL